MQDRQGGQVAPLMQTLAPLSAGASAYLSKPIVAERLLPLLKSQLDA